MAEATPKPVTPPSDSALYMWRCVVAIAQADGEVDDEELEYLDTFFTRIAANEAIAGEMGDPAWLKILGEDLAAPQKIETLLPKVTDPEDLHHLFYFAGLMAQSDGAIKPDEEAILRKIGTAGSIAPADIDKYLAKARQAVNDHSFTEALHASDIGNLSDFKAVFDALLKKIGIKAGDAKDW